jgi:lauroyl/myristoyl acyltransferase
MRSLQRSLPQAGQEEIAGIALEQEATLVESTMGRGYGIFRDGWPADVAVTGLDHLIEAHVAGRGVVVWLMSFLEATPFNLAAAAAGLPVTHLTSPTHGITGSGWVSRRVVAPLVLRGERRSQGSRVVISGSGPGYLRELMSALQNEQATVTIRGDYTVGRLMIRAPYLSGFASFPTGAPSLAYSTGAPLLTTATIRRGPMEHEVIIDPPITTSRELDRPSFLHGAVEEFAARLDARVRAHPGSRPHRPLMEQRLTDGDATDGRGGPQSGVAR